MAEKEENTAGEQDDEGGFLRTGDIVCLTCLVASQREGAGGESERVCLSTEGFGNRMCSLEPVSDKDCPPDISSCMLYIDNALSVRALQEMMSADGVAAAEGPKGGGGSGGHKTLLYGHAVQLKHVQSEMYMACLASSSSNDKLAFDVGVQEGSEEGESSWWTIHPASKQRSEGEKVRAGDDVILVSVATERYLHMTKEFEEFDRFDYMVIASFHQTLWNVTSISSGSIRIRNMGFLFGNDVLRLFHGNDECLTIPENWSEYPAHNMVIYEGGPAVSQARSLWRIELIRTKWHGALVGYEQPFRIRHITTGRYLGVVEGATEKLVQLLHRDRATYQNSAFVLCQNKDPRKQMLDEKEEEGMGQAMVRYGETNAFIRHVEREVWLTYQTSEVTKKGLGKVEEKKAIAHSEGHMDDCYCFFMALDEESMSARVIRKCSAVLNKFLKGIEGLQVDGNESMDWRRVDLQEVLKLMEDLIGYFAQPRDELDFESRQNRFRALRSRQDLFQAEGVLNMILETIDKFSAMESLPNFAGLVGEQNQLLWEEISTYLYLLVAAMIKGNHSNCAQFAALLRLDWLFGRLSNPQSAEGILDVLYCVLTESPEALNMINEGHIRSVISLLEKVGRDPKVLDVLSSLCEGNGMAVRSSQNTITEYLLPGKDLLLQTQMRNYVSSLMPNILVGVIDGSSLFKRWYYEAEVENVEACGPEPPYLRVGWANTVGFKTFPGPGDGWGCGGVGDDFYSYGFDGMNMLCAGKARQVSHRLLRKGDVVGCLLDLIAAEIRFTLNGQPVYSLFKNFNVDGFFFPVMSLSAKVSCRFIFGRTHGRLKFGPPGSFSPIFEALNCPLSVQECLSFGDTAKNIFSGPSTVLHAIEPFVPTPIETQNVALPSFAIEAHLKFAENLHELWAMRKIDLGWIYGEVRNEQTRRHPCITSFDRLPEPERVYNINLALDTMRTIEALGWHMMLDKPPTRLRPLRLPQSYMQPNGYKPQPLDTHEIELPESMEPLIDALARNTHNVWAREKIRRGWTFGISEFVDATQKRTPHLVPYEQVDERIKEANREAAAENIRTLQLFGIFLEMPIMERDLEAEKEMKALQALTRTFRAEATYKVTTGKWYFEFEVLTEGFMRVGFMDVCAPPETKLGIDEFGFGFDGHLVRKWHQGADMYGRDWKAGDVVGCFMDLNDRTISFSLNGELLLDPSGSEMAFENVMPIDGFVPAMTLAAGQRGRFNFGQDSNSLKFFTTCGLQEGYEPFCVNMFRPMPLWYAKRMPRFSEIDDRSKLEVQRVPATAASPPCLKLCQRTANSDQSAQEKSRMEFIRLSLPVRCNRQFAKNRNKEDLHARMEDFQQKRNASLSSLLKAAQQAANREEEKPRKKGLLAAFRHSSQEPVDPDKRSLRTHKTSSFDSSNDPLLADSATAALVKSSLVDLSAEERHEKLREIAAAREKAHAPKKSSGILGRIRERQRQHKDDGKRHQRTTEDFGGGDSRSNTLKTLRSFDSTSVGGASRMDTVELPDMPSSGPGRQPTVKRRLSPLKKRFASAKRQQPLPPPLELEIVSTSRAPSSAPLPMTSAVGSLMEPVEQQQQAAAVAGHRMSLGTGQDETGPVLDDLVAMQEMGDQVDEYYFGVRIFPGQDLSNVWIGWVRPQFHAFDKVFNAGTSVRKCRYAELDHHGDTSESAEYRNCYMLNAAELLGAVADIANTKVSGLQIGCLIDTSLGELSFHAQGQDTGMRFKLEPAALLYPAVFIVPTSNEMLQFELGRIKFAYPLSSAMFKSSAKSLIPYCPPRLTVETLRPVHWARVPSETLRATALKLSDTIGWSVLCDDPVRALMVYIPERDESVDILELIEKPDLLKFHARTLNLYCKLAAHGNQRVAHQLCAHVDERQLSYAVQNPYLSGPMRQGLINFLIAVYLRTHADARLSTAKEFVLPLVPEVQDQDVFAPDAEGRYPQILGPVVSILPVMKCEPVQTNLAQRDNSDARLFPPQIDFQRLKVQVMAAFRLITQNAVMSCRDFIGGDNLNHFEPILKLLDTLLVIGLIGDEDLMEMLQLLQPSSFADAADIEANTHLCKGLADIELAEGVKLQLCSLLDHICDIQARHRIESLIAFCDGFVAELQQDQCRRYLEIKQTEMPPAEAAKRTKEFRCPPKEQMYRLLNCKVKEDRSRMMLDDEADEDQCPTSEHLQERLRQFCQTLVAKVGRRKSAEECQDSNKQLASEPWTEVPEEEDEEELSWVDKLAQLLVAVPPLRKHDQTRDEHRGTHNFRQLIIVTLKRWAGETEMESNQLVRSIFALLLRQYAGVREMMDCMAQTYVLHERNLEDVEQFIEYLMQIRELLHVQLEMAEEAILKRGLWQLMNNRIFFQHPDLMRLLRVHEDVMSIMMNVLIRQQSAVEAAEGGDQGQSGSNNSSEMVVACSRFLCYFCRTSRLNQKAMFEHLSFLLDNATMLLARPSLRGSVPLDVAYSSFMDNNELALALKEEELDKVAVYLMRCGLQPNSELLARDYPDIGWDPVEGERYLDFLRFCVWINGENVEENANLVIRLLIRRPECLGVALKGEGQGLFAAFKEAITLSEDIRRLEDGDEPILLYSPILREHGKYPSKELEGEDYMDLGAAILDFYSSLVDLLAKCAPDPITIQAGKGDSVRARAILRSLISLEDLAQILSLRFTIPNLLASNTSASQDAASQHHLPFARLAINHSRTFPCDLANRQTFSASPSLPPPMPILMPMPMPSSYHQYVPTSSNSFGSRMGLLADTASTFANIAATLSSRMSRQSVCASNCSPARPTSTINSICQQPFLVNNRTPTIIDKKLEERCEEEEAEEEEKFQSASSSLTALSRSASCCWEEGIDGSSRQKALHTPTPPQYNESIFCRRRGVPLPKRSACNTGPQPGLLPNHKQSVLLFLDRVYGIDAQEMFFTFLEQSFLPDLRAATMMDSPRALESDTALALNRYLCNAVLPLLTSHAHFFADAEHHAALLDATLHTVYRMNRLRSLTKNQRDAVSDFLVALSRELPPNMMVKLLRKVIQDIQQMSDNVLVPLRIMTLHYERCNKYYGTGNSLGTASETEKRLSMLLFYAIFDSLSAKPYDPELFGKALPCLTAIGSSISPDYALTSERAELTKSQDYEGVWVPRPADDTRIALNNELNAMNHKFAEHFHDSWAARKLEKGWQYGQLYSRRELTHPRLVPYNRLQEYEREFYKERCAECLRALLAWGFQFELVDHDANERANQSRMLSGHNEHDFNPRPVDLNNMNLEKEMLATAERMAENSHSLWARKVYADMAANSAQWPSMPLALVPWELLTDFERRKDRFRAQEILKFFQFHGYRIYSQSESEHQAAIDRVKAEGGERSSVEKRFAFNLLEKLLAYLEQANMRMKSLKPSHELTRRNSFRREGQDVKFFEKVVLPMMFSYFNAHRPYFLASSSIVQTGTASNREKEMIASLFCRLAALLRIKNHAFGSVAKITVRCLQGLAQALDVRSLVRTNSDIVRTGLFIFFNNCADDLFLAVNELRESGQYSLLRGENLKSWISLEFAFQMIVPVLTTMFLHLAKNHFGTELLLDDIQASCYKILDSLYMVTGLTGTYSQRKNIHMEVEKHRAALGQCLGAFAACFPVAFLESEFNQNNKLSVLAKTRDQSVQVQEMLQTLSQHIPQLDKLLMDIEQAAEKCLLYTEMPNTFDVDLPLLCSYLTYWWQFGPDGPNRPALQITQVTSDHINRFFCSLLRLMRHHIGREMAPWLCRTHISAVSLIQYVTCDPVKDNMLPVAEHLRNMAEKAYAEEERMRTHPDDADDATVAEDNTRLVRDVYAFFPILMKYTDLHRAKWLKSPSWESDGIYENVAVIFRIWSLSQHFKREELNYMAQFDDEEGGIMGGSGPDMKTGKAAIAERKKRRREGQVRRDKHANSIVIACLKRLLPVGLNVFGGRELDIVQQSKERFLAKENEEKVREFIRGRLSLPVRSDPTDKNAWQLNLYRKIGKSQMRGKEEMSQEAVIDKIAKMAQVVAILHSTEHPQAFKQSEWKKMVSIQRKRAVVACFRMLPYYSIPRHRGINYFLPVFCQKWLADEDIDQDQLVADVCSDSAKNTASEPSLAVRLVEDESGGFKIEAAAATGAGDEIEISGPDALHQLIQCFQRAATSEESGHGQSVNITDDKLFIRYAAVMCRSVHIDKEDEDSGGGGFDEVEVDQAEKEEMAQALRAEQAVLANRGAAIMCLMYLSAANGEPTEMVAETLQLGIHLLSGGNKDIQKMMLSYLQTKKDVRFFTSLSGLMSKCSVLNLEMFERQIKAEGLGMGAELAAGQHQNLNDADFTCSLFRFLQLTCEGHNLDFQNYLRTQPGHTTSVNLINSTVDYLLRLQESVMDFYWHYSSKEVIDEGGKEYFLRAIQVCSQVFNTLTESIQGPCVGNQMTLANSRLWDAINGFFFLFAHMMEKLYKNSTQLELLREFLNLQKDMVVLMLSLLEGNVLNGPIGKQMVDALVESQQCVEMIIKFSDMFLKLKDLTTSQAFQDFDTNHDGWISPKEFQRAMEAQKMYSIEEITYLMMCTDVNNDGKVDYMEFTERFHNPARDIGFNLAVLLTNLKEHITNDPRLEKIVEKASSLLEYFDPFLGRIEIMGSSKRVEKIYFEIQETWLEQWGKQQIRDSKNAFLFNVLQDDGGDQGKLEAFINFCEDTIFEMQHAAEISSGEGSDSKLERALRQRDYFLQQTSAGEQISNTLKAGYKCGLSAAEALRPENVQKELKKAAKKFRAMTWTQLFKEFLRFGFSFCRSIVFFVLFLLMTIFRFVQNLMSDRDEDADADQLKLPPGSIRHQPPWAAHQPPPATPTLLRDFTRNTAAHDVDAFGIHIHHASSRSPSPNVAAKNAMNGGQQQTKAADGVNAAQKAAPESPSEEKKMPAEDGNRQSAGQQRPSVQLPPAEDDGLLKPPREKDQQRPSVDSTPMPRPSIYDFQSLFGGGGAPSYYSEQQQQQQQQLLPHQQQLAYYEPKIAEQISSRRSRSSLLNVLARNFKTIEKITLYLAFFINVILLFHRVDIGHKPGQDATATTGNEEADAEENEEEDIVETIYITGMTVPYLSYQITGWILAQVLYWLSMLHAFASFALLVSFYQLKIPLITFKREKEVARKLMFDGYWITEDESGGEDRGLLDTFFWYLDRIVISSKSFPMKYWDKFVRRKTKQKYREQVDEQTLDALLGSERSPGDTSFDYRYTCWLWTGVILTNRQFLYRVCYLLCSVLGVFLSPFFYAFLLIDVVLSFPMLKAILQSVTHNLQQLILTIMMTLVVVYLYTVVAFNFFRKFYVQEEEGGEPDRKCHYMLTCFIYHFYAGVRAGGGIGDELESPYGDELEYARMLYDISFFFFVIVILLAIMQGLIIDAFGELRDQQESATEKLESSCFVCDIGKETFDRLPRGFENHTKKEHNFANYLFFLQHLVNKDETEYTGQETYVREKYDNRDWEFFPVGECFLKTYEAELIQS